MPPYFRLENRFGSTEHHARQWFVTKIQARKTRRKNGLAPGERLAVVMAGSITTTDVDASYIKRLPNLALAGIGSKAPKCRRRQLDFAAQPARLILNDRRSGSCRGRGSW